MEKNKLIALIELLLEIRKIPKSNKKLKPGIVLDKDGKEITL